MLLRAEIVILALLVKKAGVNSFKRRNFVPRSLMEKTLRGNYSYILVFYKQPRNKIS